MKIFLTILIVSAFVAAVACTRSIGLLFWLAGPLALLVGVLCADRRQPQPHDHEDS